MRGVYLGSEHSLSGVTGDTVGVLLKRGGGAELMEGGEDLDGDGGHIVKEGEEVEGEVLDLEERLLSHSLADLGDLCEHHAEHEVAEEAPDDHSVEARGNLGGEDLVESAEHPQRKT